MSYKSRKRLLLAKIETTYGTDAAPDAMANAVLTRSISVTPMAGDDIQRNLDRPYFGNAPTVAGEKHVELQVEVELAGSGTAGTAPAWGLLLRACGMAETVNAGTDVTYNPITADEESITCWIYRDRVLHKFTGGRGTVSFTLDVNGLPIMQYRFLGLLGPVSNEALPTADTAAFLAPHAVSTIHTPTFKLHGASVSYSKCSLDLAVDVVKHQVVGPETSIQITGRSPKGTLVIEEPPLATLNLYAKARDATLGAFQLVHGTTAGNTIEFNAPAIGTGSPSEQDLNGVQMLSVPITINPVAGNDELTITVR